MIAPIKVIGKICYFNQQEKNKLCLIEKEITQIYSPKTLKARLK